jgi:hypothetical protein
VRFDLPGIPRDATITCANLKLWPVSRIGSNITFGAYVVERSVDARQATWSLAQAASPWGLPGADDTNADRAADPKVTVTISGVGQWYTFDPTNAVRAWHSGSLPNNGVLLRQSVSAASSLAFVGSGSTDVTLRPRLVATYQLEAPEPSPTPDTLVIAHITDAHIGLGPLEPGHLAQVLQMIGWQAQILLDIGDCTNDGTVEETREYVQTMNGKTTVPWKAMHGNHEVPWVLDAY